jgi:hypothetical protein
LLFCSFFKYYRFLACKREESMASEGAEADVAGVAVVASQRSLAPTELDSVDEELDELIENWSDTSSALLRQSAYSEYIANLRAVDAGEPEAATDTAGPTPVPPEATNSPNKRAMTEGTSSVACTRDNDGQIALWTRDGNCLGEGDQMAMNSWLCGGSAPIDLINAGDVKAVWTGRAPPRRKSSGCQRSGPRIQAAVFCADRCPIGADPQDGR